MAAYAALVSLLQTMDEIEHHPLPPIYLEKEQVESLTKNVTFLQEFLEAFSQISNNEEGLLLERRIAGVANMAEDIIESHVVDQILDGNYGENIISVDFYRGLQKVIEDMDLIKQEVVYIREKMRVHRQLQRNTSMALLAGSSTSSSSVRNTTMVGFDDVLLEILDKLTREESGLQIIPIVGMGGIGKTTLARKAYEHPLIMYHFDIYAWGTISVAYNVRKLLKQILNEVKTGVSLSNEKKESEIGEVLYKYLYGRRYLIIMDDMWSIDVWNEIKFFFPDNNNGSRIVVTTRLSNLASLLANSCRLYLKLLDEDKSWDLFSKIVFQEDDCPLELQGIGKGIVRSCGGLPLSIVVIGGVLAKLGFEKESWEHVKENLNSIVNLENDEQCLRIIEMSYNQLPVHLKPCFLYIGVFHEDSMIHVSLLEKLWVSEGILKPVGGRNLEEVTKDYVKDLVDRNLVLVHSLNRCTKNIKYIKMHDLLIDFCERQAEKERFYIVVRQHTVDIKPDLHFQRRLVMSQRVPNAHALLNIPLARSFLGTYDYTFTIPLQHHKLLRIFINHYYESSYSHQCLINLRFSDAPIVAGDHLHWNLQILHIEFDSHEGLTTMIAGFWNMTQLRHLEATPYHSLPDPPTCNGQDRIVLQNLQTLKMVRNLKWVKEVIERIPNIKKLGIEVLGSSSNLYLSNLSQLQKLESFSCKFDELVDLIFPLSIKKLTLTYCGRQVHFWEETLEKISSLPLLHKLILRGGMFRMNTWKTVEGQLPNIKELSLRGTHLENWEAESSHFPCLEDLHLYELGKLNEIPSAIGEIETLRSIRLSFCSISAISSAKRIQEEQQELYGEEDTVRVEVTTLLEDYEAMQGLANPYFIVSRDFPDPEIDSFASERS